VREQMGLTNLKVMVPFCRTPEEGRKVLAVMKEEGLARGENGLEVYVMCEIPSNVVRARDFAAVFDGFSIGSNDLKQLVLGVDRDSSVVAPPSWSTAGSRSIRTPCSPPPPGWPIMRRSGRRMSRSRCWP
jgi:phosphoenolpyruvate synthase/pyruvate phosphate dikinase